MRFKDWLKGKSEYLITGIAVLAVLVVAMVLCPPHYPMNDDATMKSILSGAYTGTPDGHAIYMKYPLTGILSLLYRLTKRVSWFDLFLTGCFWVSVSAVILRAYRLFKVRFAGKKCNFVCLLAGVCALCFALFLPQIFVLHYTLVAGMVGACGLFLFVTGGGILPVVLLVLCYCIRSQVFFMLLPFLLVAVLWNVLEKNGKTILKQVLVLAVGIVVCMAWNGLMYRSLGWQDYQVYNDSRTRLYDYDKLLPYEENAELFENAGISEMQHRLMDEYVLVLAEDITPGMMDTAAELTAAKRNAGRTGMEYLIYCVKEYYYHTRYNDGPYNYIFIGACILVAVSLLRRKQWWKLGLLGCFLGGRSLIWVFLIWQGRFPERVYVSLYFGEILVLAGMLLAGVCKGKAEATATSVVGEGIDEDFRSNGRSWRKYSPGIVGVVLTLLLLAAGIGLCGEMWERTEVQAENHREWTAITDYCRANPEVSYLLDVYTTVDYSGKAWDCATVQENFMLSGGWMSASPLQKERLESMDRANNCFIIAADREVDWLFEYCRERHDGLQLEKIDSILLDGAVLFDVYRPVAE